MNKRQFDQQMRKRAQTEQMTLTPDAQDRFGEAIDVARTHVPPAASRRWKISIAVAVECVVAAALILFLWPRQDIKHTAFSDQPTQPMISTVIQPQYAKAPEVDFSVDAGQTITLHTSIRNDTEEIWMVGWKAEKKGDSAPARQLVWMEPGTEFSGRAWWQANGNVELKMSYRGYRVKAKMLHWMDGEWLRPGEAGYEEQQSLIEAAFEAEALILAPGIWLNGKAGPMRLVLPERHMKEHPDTVKYYVEKGLLEDAYLLCSGGEAFVSEERTWAEEF